MDAANWGEHQHRLNARMTAIRAAEHRLWIFRVASSGISQLVTPRGEVIAQAPFPGQGEVVLGHAAGRYWGNRIPVDRGFGFLAVVATAVIMILLGWQQKRARRELQPTSDS
jgi:apolipoprotein N-acyltransferase